MGNYDDALRKFNGSIIGSCFKGKTGWANKVRAKYVAKREGSKVGIKLRVYRCPHCKLWHLTSNKERLR